MSQQTVYLGGGCFWCIEAAFKNLKGVSAVISGYAGGTISNPTYEQVCNGNTGHAEVVHVDFDPAIIDFKTILNVFFTVHDPTTMNRQGNDVGPQYRSVIFCTTPEQQVQAQEVIDDLTKKEIFAQPIVTEIKPLEVFYQAESYHQDYYTRNANQAYCQAVINPKLAKLRSTYSHLLR